MNIVVRERNLQRLSWLSRRMTRFCVNINEETCRKRLKGIFDQNGMQFVEKQNGEARFSRKSFLFLLYLFS